MSYPQPNQPVIYVTTPSNGNATAALILGLVGFFFGSWAWVPIAGLFAAFLGVIPAALAVTFGHMGRKTFKETGRGDGMAVTGLIFGYLTLGIIAITTLFWVISLIVNATTN